MWRTNFSYVTTTFLIVDEMNRGENSQAHLALIHSWEVLVRSRTQLINYIRGTAKSFGARLPKCSAESFHKKAADVLSGELAEVLKGVVATIASVTERIRDYDRRIEQLSKECYPEETGLLRQVAGVGALTSLTYVLTREDPQRFAKSRAIGAYLGLVPGKDQSGEQDPGKRIEMENSTEIRPRKRLYYSIGSGWQRTGRKLPGCRMGTVVIVLNSLPQSWLGDVHKNCNS